MGFKSSLSIRSQRFLKKVGIIYVLVSLIPMLIFTYIIVDLRGEKQISAETVFLVGAAMLLSLLGYKLLQEIAKALLGLRESARKIVPEEKLSQAGSPPEDEIGEIGSSLDSLSSMLKEKMWELKQNRAELEAYSKALEEKVEKRTKELRQEINERKETGEELAKERNLLRTLIDNLPDCHIFIKDTKNRLITTNTAHLQTLGAETLEEVIGKTDFDLFPRELAEQYYADEREVIRSGQPLLNREELVMDQTGRRRWFLTTKVPLQDSDSKIVGLVGMSRDITEYKWAEEEKEKLQAQLLQSQKMEAIGTLAGGVAHDFNNLLTAIQGYTDMAIMKIDEVDPLYRDLKIVRESSVRAANLTRQLLLFSRRQPMEFTPLDINKSVEDLLKMLDRLIGENIVINTELEPDLWTVSADAGNLEQVIMNLSVNARDAMPEGGKVTIKTKNVYIDEDYCETYSYAHPGKFVCLSVEDTGVGMDKEIIKNIFEPFFSTKEMGRGSGLGLSVVYGIVKEHKGWINVYSESEQGSSFKVYLPAVSAKPEDEPKEVVSLGGLQGDGERILLVEDEKGVREFAMGALSENGYVVLGASNTEEALNIFEREKGKFHLVLSDVVLPDRGGLKLVDELLSRNGGLRVLFSSGYTDDKSQWPIIRERGFRFIQKPYFLADLLRAVREAIEQS